MEHPVKNLGIRIPAKTLQKLRYIAAHDSRSVSSAVRVLIYVGIHTFEKEHGEIPTDQAGQT